MPLFSLVLVACSDTLLTTAKESPGVAILSPADGAVFWVDEDLVFVARAGGGTGDPADFTWVWSAGAYGMLEGTETVTGDTSTVSLGEGLPAGAYVVTAEAVDAAGRSGSDTVHFEVVVDEPPVVRFTAPGDGATLGDCDTPTVSVLVSDADATDVRETILSFAGLPADAVPTTAPAADGTASFTVGPLPEGDWSFTVVATDAHGVSGTDTVSGTVTPCIPDLCNGIDDDGDGLVDEDAPTSPWYADADADGHGDPLTTLDACAAPAGWVAEADDCNDDDAEIHPGAVERCNGLDDDCDGAVDEGATGDLLFGMPTSGEVYVAATDGSSITRLAGGFGSVSDLQIDTTSGQVWVATWDSPVIRRIEADGSGMTTIYSGNGAGGQGVAVDAAMNLLVWGEYYGDLWVGAPDGSTGATQLLTRSTISALIGSLDGIGTGLEVDPAEEQIYLFTRSNAGASGRHILRVGYDGTGLEDLRQIESQCLDLDLVNGWIYFADQVSGVTQMWRIALDGTREAYLFDLAGNTSCGGVVVDPAADRLYYLGNTTGDVWSVNVDGSDAVAIASGYLYAQGIDLLACE